MKYFVNREPVELGEGFTNDLLDRKDFGESLRNLVMSTNEGLVIALDGDWGEGKTTFVKMWQGLLGESAIPNVYFDAFRNDFLDDPFIAIYSTIHNFAKNNTEADGREKLAQLKNTAVKVSGKLLKWTAKTSLKAATLGILKNQDIEELEDIGGDIASSVASLIDSAVGDKFDSFDSDLHIVDEFRNLLQEIPAKLVVGSEDGNESAKPFVIIIDELDRCRPDYAVGILEKIKHFFSVKNVVFVLVMNKKQLESSIKCIYGNSVDASVYLQKFINFESILPKNISQNGRNDFEKYCEYLVNAHDIEHINRSNIVVDTMMHFALQFNLSLRNLDKIFSYITIVYGTGVSTSAAPQVIVCFLAVLKTIFPKSYEMILVNQGEYGNLIDEVPLEIILGSPEHQSKMTKIIDWIKAAFYSDDLLRREDRSSRIMALAQSMSEMMMSRRKVVESICNTLNQFHTNRI